MAYLLLAVAITVEVASTFALKASDGFARPVPTVLCLLGYAFCFLLLSRIVQELPVGTVYAIWSGTGTAAIATVAAVFLGQDLSAVTAVGIAMIVAGVVAINLAGTS